ncbi:hypothetical protein KKB83_04135 [Patescibacteria group bacterium]|nr:hypothetical protein [Patescibacteria group bacterium]
MSDITNVELGVCSVSFNGVDLGHTKGGVEVSYEPSFKDVSVDKYGETAVEKYLIGEKLSAKIPLAEYTLANLKVGMPFGSKAGAADARLTIGANAGKVGSTEAKELVLHPISEGTRRHDIVIHKAVVASTVALKHMIDEEKIIEVTFEALLDESKSDGNYLGFIGDSTA